MLRNSTDARPDNANRCEWGERVKGQRSGGYLALERSVLLPEGVDLLPQSALCGSPATLLPPHLFLQGEQLLLQRLAEDKHRFKGSSTFFKISLIVASFCGQLLFR